jgi:hypothetical protein
MRPLGVLGNIVIGVVALIWLILVFFLIFRTQTNIFTYMIMIMGIFITLAFFVTSWILFTTRQGGPGPWVFFGVVTFLITANQFNKTFNYSEGFDRFATAVTMSLLLVAAIIKLWDALEFTEI